MKIMLVHGAARTSIFDVSMGLEQGFKDNNINFANYALYKRIELAGAGLNAFIKEGDPEVPIEQVCLSASEALLYRAVIEGCRWVIIVSGLALHPNVILALKQVGIKIAIWFTEGPYSTKDDQELYLAQLADVAFVNERTAIPMFQELVPLVHYLPHSFNPLVHKPAQPEEIHSNLMSDAVFIGTGFPERQMLLEHINFEGINLVLGGAWNFIDKVAYLRQFIKYDTLVNSDTVKLYKNTKIGLNFHRYFPGAESANPRVFELAACGVFQISDYRKEIEEIFGDAIPMYDPQIPWQLEQKIRFYLNHPEERALCAQKALQLVQPYTFSNRAREIVDVLNTVTL